MIRVEDLMVGDWVILYDRPRKVEIVYDHGRVQADCIEEDCTVLEPIPLTSEILEKNGFTLDYDNHLKIYHGFFGKSHIIIEFSTDRKVGIEIHNEFSRKDNKGRSDLVTFARDWCDEFYIHEFQHALKLCGINLEITV